MRVRGKLERWFYRGPRWNSRLCGPRMDYASPRFHHLYALPYCKAAEAKVLEGKPGAKGWRGARHYRHAVWVVAGLHEAIARNGRKAVL